MQQPSKKVIISSSGGINASGGHVITPASVISYVHEDKRNEVFHALAADNVWFLMNPLWVQSFPGIALPVQRIFDHVPMAPALIRCWIQSDVDAMGGLFFPRLPLDRESLTPSIQIVKSAATSKSAIESAINVDITLSLFRRELLPSHDLQPFDPAVWHPAAYEVWHYFYADFAPIIESECDAACSNRFPSGACVLFRRMMHTHFADCGLVFGSMWWKFGLADMTNVSLHIFMRGMLAGMFKAYYFAPTPPAVLPPLFNAVTLGSGQRVCAGCMTFRLGTGQMKRCPCQQVYYCSAACQTANWKVHRVVCGKGGKKKAA